MAGSKSIYKVLQNKLKLGEKLTYEERQTFNFERNRELLKKQYGVRKLTDIQVRYLEKGIRYIGYWDIETSDFNPYQNFMICYCFERRDILTNKIEKYEYHITKNDISKAVKNNTFDFDYKLLQKLGKCMESVDQLIGHYAGKFDMPYFRTRCLLTKQDNLIPLYKQSKFADTWRMMKTSLKAPRNTLNNLALYTLGKSDKTHVDLEYWYKARFKDSPDWEKSIRYIIDHCRKDVTMTRKAHMKIEKFNSISGVLV